MHPLVRKSLLRFGLLHAYAFLVAWIFTLIERRDQPAYKRMQTSLKDLRIDMDLKYNLTDDDFDSFVKRASAAVIEGDELDWTLLNSFTFALAAFTTIGYGNITPKTELGKGITIPLCLLGIVMTMLTFKTAGELLACCIRSLVIKTETTLLKRDEPTNIMTKTFLVSCTFMFLLYVSASTTAVFMENWGIVESFYAWFATFSTIGFGDYIHCESLLKDEDHGMDVTIHLMIFTSILYFPSMLGLSLMSCILSCIVNSVDQIRHFRDSFIASCLHLYTRKRQALCCKRNNHVESISQGTAADPCYPEPQ